MGENSDPSHIYEMSFPNRHPVAVATPQSVPRYNDLCEDKLKQDINHLNRYVRQLHFIAAAQFVTLIVVFSLCFYSSAKLTSIQATNFPSTFPVSVFEEMFENLTVRVHQFEDMLNITNKWGGSENNKSSEILTSFARHESNFQRRLTNIEEQTNFTTAQILRSQNSTREYLLTINQIANRNQEDILRRLEKIWAAGIPCYEALECDQLKVRKFVETLSQAANESYPTIGNPFYYRYDDPYGRRIKDGGNDMYDGGNYLHVQIRNSTQIPIIYNKTFGTSDDIYVGYSRTSHPFVLSMLVRKNIKGNFQLVLQENGNLGADGSGSYSSYAGQFYTSSLAVEYEVYQVYGARDPSIIQVYFYATSSQMFGTTGSGTLSLNIGVKSTQSTINKVTLSGDLNNAYFGYLLLSRYPPNYFGSSYMKGYLLTVFQRFSELFGQK